jgi:plasmid maintenance system antidote protein VapI
MMEINAFSEISSSELRQFLQNELVERCKKNPSYSLRAFAQALKINHTTLSRILRSERGLSQKMQSRITKALGLSPSEVARLHEHQNDQRLQKVTQDVFAAIADWYHDAILELPRLRRFKPEPKWISKELGINLNEVNAALSRLQRLKLLKIQESGEWSVLLGDSTNILDPDYTNIAARRLQTQILEKAVTAIESVSSNQRDNTSVLLAIDSRDLPKIKRLIKEFRRELISYAQKPNKNLDQLYQLAIAFYPLTQGKEE